MVLEQDKYMIWTTSHNKKMNMKNCTGSFGCYTTCHRVAWGKVLHTHTNTSMLLVCFGHSFWPVPYIECRFPYMWMCALSACDRLCHAFPHRATAYLNTRVQFYFFFAYSVFFPLHRCCLHLAVIRTCVSASRSPPPPYIPSLMLEWQQHFVWSCH